MVDGRDAQFLQALRMLGLEGVPYEEISAKRISSAFRARIFVVHPDRRGDEEHARELASAKEVLLSFLQGEENFGFLNDPAYQIAPDREYLHEDICEFVWLLLMHGDVVWHVRSKLSMPSLPKALFKIDEELNVQYTYPSWVHGAFKDDVPSVSREFLEILRLLTALPPSQILHIRIPKRLGLPTKNTQMWILWASAGKYNSLSLYVKKTA